MSQDKRSIIAGIDPGVKTGVAVWDTLKQEFNLIETWSIIKTMGFLKWESEMFAIEIWFEDARLRDWFPEEKGSSKAIAKLQGAGSIKRDCAIWQEFCEYYKIPFKAIKPAPGNTKWDAKYFKKVTGWTRRTSQHSRDAALLVFGVK